MQADRVIVLLATVAACAPPGDRGGGRAAGDTAYAMHRVAGHALVLPRGFRVDLFASRVGDVRFLALSPDGTVYATLRGPGHVVRLPDADGDGHADAVELVLEHLQNPHGIAFRGDTLYVAEVHQVIRLVPGSGAPEVVVPALPAGPGHSTRTIVFRGDEMFVSVGSSCNLCDERDERRAAVLRFHADGTGGEVYATGLRNSVGLAVHPESHEIWATNNDRDRLGDDRPPDRVNILRPGGFYGWPQCYLPGMPNPEYADHAARCDSAIGPAVSLPAHAAPLGLAFYQADQFPADYRGNLFIALHGSWDRSFPIGYKVVRVPVAEGRAAGPWQDFVSGWQVGRRAWGRPVDVLVAPDGSLLVSDDRGGRIFRVWYAP